MFVDKIESGRQPIILCVDDEPDGLYLRRLILERSGYTVIASTHPARALDMMEQQHVDVALIDYQMPQMNGAVLSAHMKKKTPRLKVIMFSGASDIPEEGLGSVDCFVSKGDGMPRVLKIISGFLAQGSNSSGQDDCFQTKGSIIDRQKNI